jgi:hypothetical protein
MIPKWILTVVFFSLSLLGFTITGIMYTKLSFIDWPYLLGGLIFLIGGLFAMHRNKN